ncbi:hypothetical protein Hanom_Chr12g01077991 [Helianthus anomalus]
MYRNCTLLDLRLWGMGFGLGRGLGENTQATTPGGLGLGRGPWGLGLKPSVGRV